MRTMSELAGHRRAQLQQAQPQLVIPVIVLANELVERQRAKDPVRGGRSKLGPVRELAQRKWLAGLHQDHQRMTRIEH